MLKRAVVLASLCAAASASAEPRELTISDLGWPVATLGGIAKRRVTVVDAMVKGKPIASVLPGTRLSWSHIFEGDRACKAWLMLEPRGWACSSEVTPTEKVATNEAPPMQREQWADVRGDGADAFATPAQIRTSTAARHVPGRSFVALRGNGASVVVDGARYYRTDQGWIAGRSLAWYEPSGWAGLELATNAWHDDLAWAIARGGGKVEVRAEPKRSAKVLRKLAPRERVSIVEAGEDFVRIAGAGPDAEWVARRDLRLPQHAQRPDGVSPHERWIDVDLDGQWLVAYEGDTPVFVTLVSTGRKDWVTPTGIYRIRGKEAVARMKAPAGMSESWDVADVPWSMRFRQNFALHGTYWHDSFGRIRSHGCVNLSTADAKRLWSWVSPEAPPGWIDVEAELDLGTPVRIHSERDPMPSWRDYDGKPLARSPKLESAGYAARAQEPDRLPLTR